MRNSIKIVIIILILVIIAAVLYLKFEAQSPYVLPSPSPSASVSASPSPTPLSDMIQVTTPVENDLIDPAKPIDIEGQARGNWYFEASFPVELVDANGNSLAQEPIQASGSWMTTDFVPFSKQLKFVPPTTATGTLILRNDNPSGDPAKALELDIPLRFNIKPATQKE
ncbi:MAG: Gmad2 immunoglobulin-like domain-containing protein [Minisyncoccia bacterium]